MPFNSQALEINEIIQRASKSVFKSLAERGKAIYFPKKGILSQSAEAKDASINATIGTALEDAGLAMVLDSINSLLNLKACDGFSYAPSFGRPEIRAAWREMMLKKNPTLAGKGMSLPIVTSALTHGLSMAGYLFVDPNDRVISPDRYWENYDLIFSNAYSATIDTFSTFIDNSRFNIEGLREKLMQGPIGKKIVILNFPNNPTGYTITEEEAQRLRTVLIEVADAGNNLVVLIDDAYFGLVFEKGIFKESMFSLLADAHENLLAVKFDGPTKEDYVWGFRVGFMTFGIKNGSEPLYRAIEAKLAGAIRGNISNASNVAQSLLLSAYNNPVYDSEKTQKHSILQRRYEKIKEILATHQEYAPLFYPLPFNSGYFMCVKIVSGKAEEIRKKLLLSYDTGTIAQGDILRIAFSSIPFAMLEKLFDNLYRATAECA